MRIWTICRPDSRESKNEKLCRYNSPEFTIAVGSLILFSMVRCLGRSNNRNKKYRPSYRWTCERSRLSIVRVVIKSASCLQKKKRKNTHPFVFSYHRTFSTIATNCDERCFELTHRWFICVFGPTNRHAYLRSQYSTNCKGVSYREFFQKLRNIPRKLLKDRSFFMKILKFKNVT